VITFEKYMIFIMDITLLINVRNGMVTAYIFGVDDDNCRIIVI
jgi:hypothetical protein